MYYANSYRNVKCIRYAGITFTAKVRNVFYANFMDERVLAAKTDLRLVFSSHVRFFFLHVETIVRLTPLRVHKTTKIRD